MTLLLDKEQLPRMGIMYTLNTQSHRCPNSFSRSGATSIFAIRRISYEENRLIQVIEEENGLFFIDHEKSLVPFVHDLLHILRNPAPKCLGLDQLLSLRSLYP